MAEKFEKVQIENRVLQARLQEMESQVNSLSTNVASRGRDSQLKESQLAELQNIKSLFENKLQQLQQENNEKEQFFQEMRSTQ